MKMSHRHNVFSQSSTWWNPNMVLNNGPEGKTMCVCVSYFTHYWDLHVMVCQFVLFWKSQSKIYGCSVERIVMNRPYRKTHNSLNSSCNFFFLFHLQGSACFLLRRGWATPPGSAWSVSAPLLRPTQCDCWPSSVGPRPRSSTTSAWRWCCRSKIARSPSPPRRSCCSPTVSTANFSSKSHVKKNCRRVQFNLANFRFIRNHIVYRGC